MKKGDVYRHYKGGIYTFIGIAVPEQVSMKNYFEGSLTATHSETQKGVSVQRVPAFDNCYISDLDEPVVLYREGRDGKMWARPVDMFFDYKPVLFESSTRPEPVVEMVKRFTKIM